MSEAVEFLWYIPNQVQAGHRGDPTVVGHNSLDTLTRQALPLEEHGWKGALLGAGTTWLVGSAEDVARALRRYQALGITHFVLSDAPYLAEIKRQGDRLLPLLKACRLHDRTVGAPPSPGSLRA